MADYQTTEQSKPAEGDAMSTEACPPGGRRGRGGCGGRGGRGRRGRPGFPGMFGPRMMMRMHPWGDMAGGPWSCDSDDTPTSEDEEQCKRGKCNEGDKEENASEGTEARCRRGRGRGGMRGGRACPRRKWRFAHMMETDPMAMPMGMQSPFMMGPMATHPAAHPGVMFGRMGIGMRPGMGWGRPAMRGGPMRMRRRRMMRAAMCNRMMAGPMGMAGQPSAFFSGPWMCKKQRKLQKKMMKDLLKQNCTSDEEEVTKSDEEVGKSDGKKFRRRVMRATMGDGLMYGGPWMCKKQRKLRRKMMNAWMTGFSSDCDDMDTPEQATEDVNGCDEARHADTDCEECGCQSTEEKSDEGQGKKEENNPCGKGKHPGQRRVRFLLKQMRKEAGGHPQMMGWPMMHGSMMGHHIMGGPMMGGPMSRGHLMGEVMGGPMSRGPMMGGMMGGPMSRGPMMGGMMGGPMSRGPMMGGMMGGPMSRGPMMGGMMGGPMSRGPMMGGMMGGPMSRGPMMGGMMGGPMMGGSMTQGPMMAAPWMMMHPHAGGGRRLRRQMMRAWMAKQMQGEDTDTDEEQAKDAQTDKPMDISVAEQTSADQCPTEPHKSS